jgi:hypothetical protein
MRQRTISDFFWRDPEIYDLSQEDKATLLYFLTSPSSNIVGVYQIVWGIAAAEMGWTKDQMLVVTKRLQSKRLIDFNENGWVWVKTWWKHNSCAGAFSPKLLKNSKKQCDAMPEEWLEGFIKSVEIAGLDRVSIGYGYPTDTLPPNTTCISNSNTTTTTPELVFPKELSEPEKESVLGLLSKVQFFPLDKKQELLDELAGSINKNAITASRISFFCSLVDAAQRSYFVPKRGLNVLSERSRAAKIGIAIKPEKMEISEYGKNLLPDAMRAAAERVQTATSLT